MNSCKWSDCNLVPRPSSYYPVFSTLSWPAPVSHMHPSSFSISHPALLQAHYQRPSSPPHHQSSAVAKKSFLIKDILSNCDSLKGTEAVKQDKMAQSTISGLHTLPSSMFSFYVLPTQKERYKQLGFPRARTMFSPAQLDKLEAKFAQKKYLSTPERFQFADALGLTPVQIKTWFQNRRMKWKKELQRVDPTLKPTRAKGRPPKSSYPDANLKISAER